MKIRNGLLIWQVAIALGACGGLTPERTAWIGGKADSPQNRAEALCNAELIQQLEQLAESYYLTHASAKRAGARSELAIKKTIADLLGQDPETLKFSQLEVSADLRAEKGMRPISPNCAFKLVDFDQRYATSLINFGASYDGHSWHNSYMYIVLGDASVQCNTDTAQIEH
ncbi:MAG: hypothetical protein H6707_17165 [Deltaproteobacteria bacterium]|nr:hypothetical protein [Deltaproteobacteria bacterium]